MRDWTVIEFELPAGANLVAFDRRLMATVPPEEQGWAEQRKYVFWNVGKIRMAVPECPAVVEGLRRLGAQVLSQQAIPMTGHD